MYILYGGNLTRAMLIKIMSGWRAVIADSF